MLEIFHHTRYRAALFFCLHLLISSIYSDCALAKQKEEAAEESKRFLASKKNILFDVTNSRGGNGDVAAAYLTAQDFIQRYHYPHPILFRIDDSSKKILSTLLGKIITHNTTALEGKILFYEKLPPDMPTTDLYLQLSAEDGILKDAQTKFYNVQKELAQHRTQEKIPVHDRTIVLTQPIFGAGETKDKLWAHGTISIGDTYFRTRPPGIGNQENGIYFDPIAAALTKLTPEQKKEKGLAYINEIAEPEVRENILAILQKKKLEGANWGLVYGVLDDNQEKQLDTFLKGLASNTEKNPNTSYILFSPQDFDPTMISQEMRKFVRVLVPGDTLPQKAEPGIIYILNTGKIPHPAFTSLLALSELPPLIEGNATLSAALILRRNFILTRTSWTTQDVSSVGKMIRSHFDNRLAHSPQAKELIEQLFPSTPNKEVNLAEALRLNNGLYPKIFSELKDDQPILTEKIVSLAKHAQDIVDGNSESIRVAQAVSDSYFRIDALSYAARRNDGFAQERLQQILRTIPTKEIPYFASDLQFILFDSNSQYYKTYVKRFRDFLLSKEAISEKELFIHQVLLRMLENEGKNLPAVEKFLEAITKDIPIHSAKTILAGILLQYHPRIIPESAQWLLEKLKHAYADKELLQMLYHTYHSQNIHHQDELNLGQKIWGLKNLDPELEKLIDQSLAWSFLVDSMQCRLGYTQMGKK